MEKNYEEKDYLKTFAEIEERYNKVLQFSSDAVFIDRDGIIAYANPTAIKLMEVDGEEEILNKSILNFIHKDFHEIVKRRIKATKEANKILPAKEVDFISSKGKVIHMEVTAINIPFNGVKHNIIFARDITYWKKLEQSNREREEILRTVAENTLDLFVMCNTKGKITFASPSHLHILGYKPKEVLDGNWVNLVHPEDKERLVKTARYTLSGKGNGIARWRCRCKNGNYKYLESYAKPVFKNNKVHGIVVSSRDLTDKIKAEEAQRSMEEKARQLQKLLEYENFRNEFFANLSHEIRTPINVIFSAIQLLSFNIDQMDMNYRHNENFKKYIKVMKQNCNRIIRIINNLIDVSKLESGYFDLKLSNNNIVSLVEDISLSVVVYAKSKGIDLIFDTEVEEKIMACDPDLIERILLNLISNALKFTDNGGKIFVNIFDKKDKIIISVKDTGIGIAPDKQNYIFERFVQVDEGTCRKRQGSGIGLSLVKYLVQLHKGDIKVVSKLGEGSEFIVELPVTLVEENENEDKLKQLPYNKYVEKIEIEFSDIY